MVDNCASGIYWEDFLFQTFFVQTFKIFKYASSC